MVDGKADPITAVQAGAPRPATPGRGQPTAASPIESSAGTRVTAVPGGLDRSRGAQPDLDRTDELPVLHLAAYETAIDDRASASAGPIANESDSPGDNTRPTGPISLPSNDTLRDIEAWIAAQNARDHANQQALALLRESHADAHARAEKLATELEGVRSALHSALARANDGERFLLESRAAVLAAETRASQLASELEQSRAEASSIAQRLATGRLEFEAARDSVAKGARAEAEQDRDHSRRAQSVAEARSQCYLEGLESAEWRRGVWEGMWHELDVELDAARAALALLERERTELRVAVESTRAELTGRSAAIERLDAERAAQAAALAELTTGRSVDKTAHQAAVLELSARNAALTAEVGALEDARRQLAESLAAREADLTGAVDSRAALESALRGAAAQETAQTQRIADLDSITASVTQALQAQTTAVHHATALLETRDRRNASLAARVHDLETQLRIAVEALAERSAAAQAAEATATQYAAESAAHRARLETFERDTRAQLVRIETLEGELAKASALMDDVDAPRRALEAELERLRDEQARRDESAVALDAQHRSLVSELERARGALEERELRMRRLERQVTASAQMLTRIKVGMEQAAPSPDGGSQEIIDSSAALIALDGAADVIKLRNGRTTIGRGPDNDVCLGETTISRHHAAVVVGSNGAFIEDQKSVNGVTVNGRRVRLARLSDGDIIELGLTRFRLTTRAAVNPELS